MSVNEIRKRGSARTNYTPEEFIEAFENAENEDERGEIRDIFRSLDGGRFYEMLDDAHNVLAHSDLKRRDQFVENYSEYLIRWIKAFGTVENLNTFPDIDVE